MSLMRQRIQLGVGFTTILLILLNSGCNSSGDTTKKDSIIGTAAKITVFYPDFFEDSASGIFTQTLWAVDSNLIRFEENLPKSDNGYYEAQFEFEMHNFSQMEETDIATNNNKIFILKKAFIAKHHNPVQRRQQHQRLRLCCNPWHILHFPTPR